MNRESALLGVPTFSIFTGVTPFLDLYLQDSGKLAFIKESSHISDIPVIKRNIPDQYLPKNIELASQITDVIIDLAEKSRI
jgi:predicted glycosyltransferase